MRKKVDIRLLQEAQTTMEHLQAKLDGRSFVSHEHYAALQLERDQLAARVGELVGHMQTLTDCLSEAIDSKKSYDHFQRSTSANNTAYELLNRTSAASLARHDAVVLKVFGTRIYNNGYIHGHHDTVEGGYVDISYKELDEYHKEEVDEFIDQLVEQEADK